MMKVKRIKLEQLKVRSFVTTLDVNKSLTIQGGWESIADTCNCGDDPGATTTTIDTGATMCIVNGNTMEIPCVEN